MKGRIFAFVVFAVTSVASNAALTVYDFEEFPGNFFDTAGDRTSLVSVKDGVTMTVTRSSGSAFCVFDLQSHAPAFRFPKSWGDRALSPFFNAALDDYFVCNFDKTLSYFEVEMTDFAQDSDTMELHAFTGLNCTGNEVGTAVFNWGTASAPNWAGLATYSEPIRSVCIRGGSREYPNSMYIDNIGICEAVPEPATMATIGAGIVGLIARRRKK